MTRADLEELENLRKEIINRSDEIALNGYTMLKGQMLGKEQMSNAKRRVKERESFNDSDISKQINRQSEVYIHNKNVEDEFIEGEEGIDYFNDDSPHSPKKDPRNANVGKIKNDLRAYINHLKITDPTEAKHFENTYLKRSEFDEAWEEKMDLGPLMEHIRFYPGSDKGPLPEDDPEHYSEWFMANQPPNYLIYGDDLTDFADIGVKTRYVSTSVNTDELEMVSQ